MDNKQGRRCFVFIDGNNFYYKLREFSAKQETLLKLLEFDYREFANHLTGEDTVAGVRYYIGAVKRQGGLNREKSEKLFANQQKLIAKLQQQEIPVILGSLIQHPDKSFHEKGVDVRLAVEMIRLAREDAYDIAYLLSSDTDLVPAVEEVRSFGKSICYIGVANGQSFGLTKAANNTILLRDEDVIPYFPKTLL